MLFIIILKNQNNIVNGIIHQTSIFATGVSKFICQKFVNTIGRTQAIADIVKTKLCFIEKKLGKKKNILSKKFFVYKIHTTAKKLK